MTRLILGFGLFLVLGFIPASAQNLSSVEGWVQLRSGDVVEGEIALTPSLRQPEFVAVAGRSYAVHQINTFEIDGQRYGVAPLIARRQTLLRPVQDGRVTVYREVLNPHDGPNYVQHEDGPILMATRANLRSVLSDNERSMAYLDRDRNLELLGWAGFVTATSLVGYGTAIELDQINGSNGTLIALTGVGVGILVGTVLPVAQRHARAQAVRVYNR